MSKMQITAFSRRAVEKDTFQIVVIKKNGEEVALKTLVTKINKGMDFRKGAKTFPVEQYEFDVAGKKVDRFDQAAALIMKRHQIELVEDAKVPAYVVRAAALNTTAA